MFYPSHSPFSFPLFYHSSSSNAYFFSVFFFKVFYIMILIFLRRFSCQLMMIKNQSFLSFSPLSSSHSQKKNLILFLTTQASKCHEKEKRSFLFLKFYHFFSNIFKHSAAQAGMEEAKKQQQFVRGKKRFKKRREEKGRRKKTKVSSFV